MRDRASFPIFAAAVPIFGPRQHRPAGAHRRLDFSDAQALPERCVVMPLLRQRQHLT